MLLLDVEILEGRGENGEIKCVYSTNFNHFASRKSGQWCIYITVGSIGA